jgi:hypothetical protein
LLFLFPYIILVFSILSFSNSGIFHFWHFLLHASGIFHSGIFCSGTFQNLKFGHFLFGHKVETQWKHNASRKIA